MDNRYFANGCPPLMSDGRFITNYTNNSVMNQYVRNMNNLNSTHDYRVFIQENAETIMNNERKFNEDNNMCSTDCSTKVANVIENECNCYLCDCRCKK